MPNMPPSRDAGTPIGIWACRDGSRRAYLAGDSGCTLQPFASHIKRCIEKLACTQARVSTLQQASHPPL